MNTALDTSEDLDTSDGQASSQQDRVILIAADVDHVSSYVFESAKLSEMRGASLILDLLNTKRSDDEGINQIEIESEQKIIKGIPQIITEEFGLSDDYVIYVAGGSALICAPVDKAEQIKKRIERLYIDTTLTATITVVSLQVSQLELNNEIEQPFEQRFSSKAMKAKGAAWRLIRDNLVKQEDWGKYSKPTDLSSAHYDNIRSFGKIYAELAHRIRRAKDSKTTAPIFEVSPFSERCAYCHFRPSHALAPAPADEIRRRPICRACNLKREAGNKSEGHGHYIKAFKTHLDKQASQGRGMTYMQGVKTDWKQIISPPDLNAVAEAAKGKATNYVGIIYADGNDMGAAIEGLQKLEDFKLFANGVREAIETAVFNSLGQFLDGPRESARERLVENGTKIKKNLIYHPFEIVSIGGDDVYLFVPADLALEIALSICREFEQNIQNALNRKLTLSAGVLIAHVNTPIYFSRSVVKGLMKHAKSFGKSNSETISAIDFQVITADTAAAEEISEFRRRAYMHNRFNEVLTTRPLALDDLERMINLMRSLKAESFPLNQLYQLREAVVAGPQPRATNFYYYQQCRNDDMKKRYTPLHNFLVEDKDESLLPFWSVKCEKPTSEKITPIVDILEIYDFIRKSK